MVHRRQPRKPSGNALSKHISDAARKMSATLTQRGYRHALIGGLAVNYHGYKRTTDDVDFLVSGDAEADLAGDPLGGEVRGKTMRTPSGVIVDIIFPNPGEEFLEAAIRNSVGSVPVIPKTALVYLKLVAGRMKDTADVVELLKRGKLDPKSIVAYLRAHRSDLVDDFKSLVSQAELEAD